MGILKALISILALAILSKDCFSQFEEKYWVFGNSRPVHIQFSYTGPTSSWASPFTTNPSPPPASVILGSEGSAVATDPQTGQLLFYTDGEYVYDNNHNLILSGLGASPSSSQPASLCLKPQCPFDTLYIFSNPTGVVSSALGIFTVDPVTYRKYSISSQTFSSPSLRLSGPNGNTNVGEGMLIVRSKSNSLVFWLITHIYQSDNYVVYRIDSSGVGYHGLFQFGSNSTGYKQFAYSSVRNEMAFTSEFGTKLYVCRFDANSGNFLPSTYSALNGQGGELYGIEYSPSGNFLYYAQCNSAVNQKLWQYNLASNQSILIEALSGSGRKGGLKSGPDGFIYHISRTDAGGTTTIGRIETPDLPVNDPNFVYKTNLFSYSSNTNLNFPQFIITPSYDVQIQSTNTMICFGASVSFTSSVNSAGLPVSNYQWYRNGSTIPGADSASLTVNDTGTYFLLVSFNQCDKQSNQIHITGTTINSVPDTIPISICQGDSFFAGGANQNSPGTYFDTLISANSCDSVLITNLKVYGGVVNTGIKICEADSFFAGGQWQHTPGTYFNHFTVQNGCDSIAVFELTIHEFLSDTFIISICDGDSLLAGGDYQSVTGLYADSFIASGGCDSVVITDLQVLTNSGKDISIGICEGDSIFAGGIFQTQSGLYYDTLLSQNNCDSVIVTHLETYPSYSEVINDSICSGESFYFNGTNYSLQGTYQADLKSRLNCDSTIVLNLTVIEGKLSMNHEGTVIIQSGDSLILSANSENPVVAYHWLADSLLSCNDCQGIIIKPKGNVTVTLTTTDIYGCDWTDSVVIKVQDELMIPNAFTPNGDGINDEFKIQGNFYGEINFKIFDRWGEKIFETNDPSEGWDGTFRGKPLNPNVFVYMIQYIEGDKQKMKKGSITLIR